MFAFASVVDRLFMFFSVHETRAEVDPLMHARTKRTVGYGSASSTAAREANGVTLLPPVGIHSSPAPSSCDWLGGSQVVSCAAQSPGNMRCAT